MFYSANYVVGPGVGMRGDLAGKGMGGVEANVAGVEETGACDLIACGKGMGGVQSNLAGKRVGNVTGVEDTGGCKLIGWRVKVR